MLAMYRSAHTRGANCDKLVKVLYLLLMSPTLSAPRRALKIPLTRAQWVILILLVLSVTINYIDRGSLSAADKYLEQDFGLDPQRRGEIYSAFFAGYAGLMLLAGWLVDRFDVNRVLAIGFMIWTTRDSAHRRGIRFRNAHRAATGPRRR